MKWRELIRLCLNETDLRRVFQKKPHLNGFSTASPTGSVQQIPKFQGQGDVAFHLELAC